MQLFKEIITKFYHFNNKYYLSPVRWDRWWRAQEDVVPVKLRMKLLHGGKENIRVWQAIGRIGQREGGWNVYSGLMINGYNLCPGGVFSQREI